MRNLIASPLAAIGLERKHFKIGVAAWLGGTALAALLCAGVPSAQAVIIDSFPSTLTVTQDAALGTGPFGTVEVDLNSSTTATITFTAASGFYFIDSSIADLEVNAATFTVGGFSATLAPGSTGSASNLSFGGSGNVNGFGVFNLTINNKDGTAQALTQVDFTVTDAFGTWASAADVLAMNPDGFDAAAHVLACSGAPTTSVANDGCGTSPPTGFVAENAPSGSGPPPIPEPGTLFIFGSGLAGLALVRRYRKLV